MSKYRVVSGLQLKRDVSKEGCGIHWIYKTEITYIVEKNEGDGVWKPVYEAPYKEMALSYANSLSIIDMYEPKVIAEFG